MNANINLQHHYTTYANIGEAGKEGYAVDGVDVTVSGWWERRNRVFDSLGGGGDGGVDDGEVVTDTIRDITGVDTEQVDWTEACPWQSAGRTRRWTLQVRLPVLAVTFHRVQTPMKCWHCHILRSWGLSVNPIAQTFETWPPRDELLNFITDNWSIHTTRRETEKQQAIIFSTVY